MLAAGVAVDRPGSIASPSLRVGAGASLDRSFSEPGGTATFGWIAGLVDACPLALRLGGAGRLRPCAVGEYGVLRARGSNTLAPGRITRPWAAAGVALRYAMPIAGPIRLEAALEVLASIEQDRFFLGGAQVFLVPPAHAKLVVGVGF